MVSPAPATEEHFKRLVKQALAEALEERRDLVREIVAEVLEDLGLARAIEEGYTGQNVSREEVMSKLKADP